MLIDICNLATTDELRSAHPLVMQLRPHLDADAFVAQALRQIEHGYRATALLEAGVARAYAGWRVQEYLFRGVHLYVDDVENMPIEIWHNPACGTSRNTLH